MKTYSAKIILDSVGPTGTRLVTAELIFPRKVLAEANTHRALSKNSASSRAVPLKKTLQMVRDNPYIPSHWGKNQRGMQAFKEVLPEKAMEAEKEWLKARDFALQQAEKLADLKIHKQVANRILEPFMWHTVLISGTEWSNFLHLRNHEDADPDIRKPAALLEEALKQSEPSALQIGEWHMPLMNIGIENEIEKIMEEYPNDPQAPLKISIARCARVSYLSHDGKRDFSKDMELFDRLDLKHLSPFEHVATPFDPNNIEHCNVGMYRLNKHEDVWFGNFKNWVQYRKLVPFEWDVLSPDNHAV